MKFYNHGKGRGNHRRRTDIALIGNPNTGKSCLFNNLTGVGTIVSNYPGTTVDLIRGKTQFDQHTLNVVDLPGVYSIGTASQEDAVVMDFLLKERVGMVVNVIDANLLERNLYLTLQLIELGIPTVVALNFNEEAEKKGITIDIEKLSKILNVPVIPINAVRGNGTKETMEAVIASTDGKRCRRNSRRFSNSIENSSKIHKQAESIIQAVLEKGNAKKDPGKFLDKITTNPKTGMIILLGVFAVLFSALFFVGGALGGLVNRVFTFLIGAPLGKLIALVPNETLQLVLSFGLIEGINAGLQIVLPYIAVFYFLISFLEDSGYLPRMAYLLDKTMHKFNLHGNAVIPMLLGFGCTVPAIMATRTLPNKKDRVITATIANLIPCSARTAVILGAAGTLIGWQYALLIYAVVVALIISVAFLLGRGLPGQSTGLIMEMPPYRMPSMKSVLKKTWMRMKSFIYVAFPYIIIGSAVLALLKGMNILDAIARPFEPIMTGWLMLPAVTGITLIYGILRKELALEMLVLLAGTATLTGFMTPIQIFTFSLVVTLYFPCLGTWAVLKREFGWKTSIIIALSTIAIAILFSGLFARLLLAIGVF